MTTLKADLQAATVGSRELSDRVLLACGWQRDKTIWRSSAGETVDANTLALAICLAVLEIENG